MLVSCLLFASKLMLILVSQVVDDKRGMSCSQKRCLQPTVFDRSRQTDRQQSVFSAWVEEGLNETREEKREERIYNLRFCEESFLSVWVAQMLFESAAFAPPPTPSLILCVCLLILLLTWQVHLTLTSRAHKNRYWMSYLLKVGLFQEWQMAWQVLETSMREKIKEMNHLFILPLESLERR